MSPLPRHRISLQTLIKIGIGALLLGLFIWYGGFQARLLIAGPQIELVTPTETVQHAQIVTLSGVARNATTLTVNDRPINLSEEGHFEEALVLENGYTIMTIRAEDRYGEVATLTREFVYAPQETITQ